MKRFVCLVIAMLAVFMFSACSYEKPAEAPAAVLQPQKSAAGMVEAVNVCQITAPFDGMLCPFDLEQGGTVKKGDALFTLDTRKVYALCDGTVGSARALPGDSAEAVQARYGALCHIEPNYPLRVNASISGTYNSAENKLISTGEKLYIKKHGGKASGSGSVISVKGSSYVVEVNDGSFKIGDNVQLYLKNDHSLKSKTGTGVITRTDPVAIVSQGTVLKAYAKQGQQVKRGDLLYEMISGNIGTVPEDNSVRAQNDGVLGSIFVVTGQPVVQGQLLASVCDNTELRVNASVDEMDLGAVEVGGTVSIVLDSFPDKSFKGTVESVSGYGVEKQNASYYDVRIAFEPDENVRIGMSATVYLT